MIEVIDIVLATVYSCICAYEDLRKRSIDIRLCIAAGALGALLFLIRAGHTAAADMLIDLLKAFIPGVMVIILSLITCGAIGLGDGIFLIILGIYMGIKKTFIVMTVAWSICALYGLFITARGILHGGGKNRYRNIGIPFVAASLPVVIIIFILKLKEVIYGM